MKTPVNIKNQNKQGKRIQQDDKPPEDEWIGGDESMRVDSDFEDRDNWIDERKIRAAGVFA